MIFIRRFFTEIFAILGFAFLFLSLPTQSYGLTCQNVETLSTVYLNNHYAYKHFDKELSKRTVDQFIKSWDPGKMYFLKSDVDKIKSQYSDLDTLSELTSKSKCKIVSDVINIYGIRFDERHKEIAKLIDAKHDFKIDEYLNLDRKKLDYANDTNELNERWRKQVKFQLLNLKDSLKDIEVTDKKAKTPKKETKKLAKEEQKLEKARKKLKKRYQKLVKQHNKQTLDEVYARFLNAFATSLDPHSDYNSPDQLAEFQISMSLSLDGIGAVLRSEDGFTIIQSIVPGGAAFESKQLKADDKIIAVAQELGEPVDVIDMDLSDVVKLIRGPRETKVKLTIVREDKGKTKQMEVEIIRKKIQLLDRRAKSKVVEVDVKDPKGKENHMKVGILNLPSFYRDFEGQRQHPKDFRSSSRDLRKEVIKLTKQNVDSIVLDLRVNGGGSLPESIDVSGLFFDKGPVVQIKDGDQKIYAQSDTDGKTYYSGPLVVLISRQSASASEIFAGAIKDYQRGLIIGDDHTFGKGTVQNMSNSGPQLGATKITISKFYRPSGASTQLNGVKSDIVLPSLLNEIEIGEKFYDFALEWDQIKEVPHQNFNLVSPYLDTLKKASDSRIKNDDGFKKIIADIKEWQKNKKDKARVSLNEAKQDKKDSKDEDEKDELENKGDMDITDDPHMQEAIKIATDYARLISKQELGKIEIPSLKKVEVAEVKNKKSKKPSK